MGFFAFAFWIEFGAMNEDLLLIKSLDSLRVEHRKIDEQSNDPYLDEFTRQRLGKMKLALRDKIYELEQRIYPDIIA